MSAPLGEHDCRLLIEKLAALHADQLRVIELQAKIAALSVMGEAAAPLSRLNTPTAAEKAAP